MNLEGADILQAETIGRPTKIPAQLRYRGKIGSLRRRRQIADRHVFDHAAAKRADLSHRKISCLKGCASKTLDPLRQEATVATLPQLPRKRLRSIRFLIPGSRQIRLPQTRRFQIPHQSLGNSSPTTK